MNLGIYNDESSLVEAIRKGNTEAFDFLFNKYYTSLVIYAASFCKDQGCCEDIVQDVFCGLYLNRKRIHLASSLKAYLLTLVKNRCIDELRHRKVRDIHAEYFLRFGLKLDDEVENYVLYNELKEHINQAMQNLSKTERICFSMCKLEGRKTSEVADSLGIPLRTVQHNIYMALKKISAILFSWLPVFLMFFVA